jgi:hypothetical protein
VMSQRTRWKTPRGRYDEHNSKFSLFKPCNTQVINNFNWSVAFSAPYSCIVFISNIYHLKYISCIIYKMILIYAAQTKNMAHQLNQLGNTTIKSPNATSTWV